MIQVECRKFTTSSRLLYFLKLRINDDDAKKLDSYFVTMIDLYSDDNVSACIREEYEVNKEEQRTLHCFKKNAHGKLDDLFDHLDKFKTPAASDDEKQSIFFLRYLLTDYHANCDISSNAQ
ncbi:hypothetical protein EDC94DRAFT_648735 [Helicostylum pulchrum]|nr:hypothetical protein EDC94DRAFT_648735 [Helicostylum pulchrum]